MGTHHLRAALGAVVYWAATLTACAEHPDSTGDGPAAMSADGAGGALVFPSCLVPSATVLDPIHAGATLAFALPSGDAVEIGTATDPAATAPEEWLDTATVTLPESGELTVFARAAAPDCDAGVFQHRYRIAAAYPGPVGADDTTAVARDSASIAGWAASVSEVAFGDGSDTEALREPTLALGPATGTSLDSLVLGEGGSVTLTFAAPLTDGEGPDLAVFENAFNDTFLELAFVEVSSDGSTFVRFDSAYLGTEALGDYGVQSPTTLSGLAGSYRQGYGTPFDLGTLAGRPEVQVGAVELARITHVRLQDIVGDGSATDSFGQPIYDPYPTTSTAGFDLDAVAALHVAAE